MRADVSQLEHPQLIVCPPPPLERQHSVVDRQGVCTLCWVDPNTDVVAVLGTECCIMFVYNGMLCNLQSCNDSSDRGATCALLQYFVRMVLDPTTRRNGNGQASKVQASIGQYVVREHAGTLGGMHMNEKVSVTVKSLSEFAPHSSTANHIQSATTWTANMTGKAGSEDNWSK